MEFILQLQLLKVIIVNCIKNIINYNFLVFVYLYNMGDFDLMPGTPKNGSLKTVYYQYSGPPPVDDTIKDPTPTGKYNLSQINKNKNKDTDMYVDEEIDINSQNNSNSNNSNIDIKKIIIIGMVIFIIIIIIIVGIIIFIVMKNKNNNNNENKKKIQEK
jgi:ATP-dependent Zn protease